MPSVHAAGAIRGNALKESFDELMAVALKLLDERQALDSRILRKVDSLASYTIWATAIAMVVILAWADWGLRAFALLG